MYFFYRFFVLRKSHLVYDQTQGSRAVFSLLYVTDNSTLLCVQARHIPAVGGDALISSLFDGLNSYMLES